MKIKNIAVFVSTILLFLCGCASNATNNDNDKGQELTVYSLDLNYYNEYTVCELEDIIVYFPVVTNKEITLTELGGVGASFNLTDKADSNEVLKVNLIAEKQDHLNYKYENYFISFLKYRLDISGTTEKTNYSSIDLEDTKLWVSHNQEIQDINFNDRYLKINITKDYTAQEKPNWNERIIEMTSEIQSKLNEKNV